MWSYHLGITPIDALWVILSAIGIYIAFFLMIRAIGQRALASWSTLDKAIVIAFGSVLGRVVLGYTPTLAAGVIGLATMFALLRLEAVLRRSKRGAYFSSRPILLMTGEEVPTGDVSVLRRGELIEPLLLRRITDQGRIPPHLVLPS